MSTLTQARLAPLSQRCLFSMRSYDPVERRHVLHIAVCSQNLQWQIDEPTRMSPKVYKAMLNSEEPNTPTSSRLLQNKFLASNGSLVRRSKSVTSLQAREGDHCRNLRHLNHLMKPIERIRLQYRKPLTKLFEVATLGKDVSPWPRAFTLNTQIKDSSHERGYHDNRSHRSNDETNDSKKSSIDVNLVATLAILGLFSKSTTGDIEEEQAKLTDEEKLHRMRPIERKIAIGVLWLCDQEYGKANQLFHEALRMAQEDKDEDQENLILNLIATNYFESGDWENAEKLFIDLMKRMIARDMAPTAPPILELSLKLASIYSKTPATHEKALKGFKFVINSLLYDLDDIVSNIEELDVHTLSDEKRDALALLGWSYDWFAKHLLNVNDYNGAADMLQRALQISSKVLGQLHDQTLILLNDIGTTLAMNNAPEEGRTFIKKAVEGAIESQSKELASFYVNLGLVNLKLRKLQEAKRYCEYSKELVGKNREHHNSHDVIELSKSCLNEIERLMGANDN